MKYFTGGTTFAISLLVAAPALPRPDSAGVSAVSRRLAHQLMTVVDYKSFVVATSAALDDAVRPGSACEPLWKQAVQAELANDEPLYEEAIAHALPSDLTTEEMRTGVLLFEGPAGELLRVTKSTPTGQIDRALMDAAERQLTTTPGARRVEDKLNDLDRVGDAAAHEFMARIASGLRVRLQQLSEAAGMKCRLAQPR